MNDRAVSDAQLIEEWRNGDENAFTELYQRYRLQLYSYLGKMVMGNTALVDDLFQQTWLRAIDRIGSYTDNQRFLAWLFTIAHNLSVDHFRRGAKHPLVPIPDQLPDDCGQPWEGMDDEQMEAALARALDELSPQQREVVMLRKQGMAFKDIADIQKTGVNTVLGRMHYAVQRLQAALSHLR